MALFFSGAKFAVEPPGLERFMVVNCEVPFCGPDNMLAAVGRGLVEAEMMEPWLLPLLIGV